MTFPQFPTTMSVSANHVIGKLSLHADNVDLKIKQLSTFWLSEQLHCYVA